MKRTLTAILLVSFAGALMCQTTLTTTYSFKKATYFQEDTIPFSVDRTTAITINNIDNILTYKTMMSDLATSREYYLEIYEAIEAKLFLDLNGRKYVLYSTNKKMYLVCPHKKSNFADHVWIIDPQEEGWSDLLAVEQPDALIENMTPGTRVLLTDY